MAWTLVTDLEGPAPPGTVFITAGAGTPAGYLECNGASVLRADYPALFAAIGTTYGSVDGTHFTLPTIPEA